MSQMTNLINMCGNVRLPHGMSNVTNFDYGVGKLWSTQFVANLELHLYEK
jgi:hypothetical protein